MTHLCSRRRRSLKGCRPPSPHNKTQLPLTYKTACKYIYIHKWPFTGCPRKHNPARVFHTVQAHLHALASWALVGRALVDPLGPCRPVPCGPPFNTYIYAKAAAYSYTCSVALPSNCITRGHFVLKEKKELERLPASKPKQ